MIGLYKITIELEGAGPPVQGQFWGSSTIYQNVIQDIIIPGSTAISAERNVKEMYPDCKILSIDGYGDI